MDAKSAKQTISSLVIGNGFVPNSGKRLFVKDFGFYAIVVEIITMRDSVGLYLNVGVKFFWQVRDHITYDYSDGDSRIDVRNHPLGALMFDDLDADFKLITLIKDAMEKIRKYHELQDFDTLYDRIKNRNDSLIYLNRNYQKRDEDLAIVKMYKGEISDAKEILANAAVHNPTAQRLLEKTDSLESFESELIDVINECRSMMTKKFKNSLKPIDKIWS